METSLRTNGTVTAWMVTSEKTVKVILGIIHLVSIQNFPEKLNSYPLIRTRTCACQEGRNVVFFGKFYVCTK